MLDYDGLSIEKLFVQYRVAMLRRALQYVDHMHDAEDIVSETWLSLFHLPKLSQMDEKARSSYILRCVQNTAISYLRERKSSNRLNKKFSDNSPHNQDYSSDIEIEESVYGLLSRLPNRERQVLELKIKGYNDSDVAEILGIASSSVRVYIHRAYKRTQAVLKDIERL